MVTQLWPGGTTQRTVVLAMVVPIGHLAMAR